MISKFINRETNTENVWEHRAILEGNKGTRTSLGDPRYADDGNAINRLPHSRP